MRASPKVLCTVDNPKVPLRHLNVLYNRAMDALDMQRKGGANSRKYMSKEKATKLAKKAAFARHRNAKKKDKEDGSGK